MSEHELSERMRSGSVAAMRVATNGPILVWADEVEVLESSLTQVQADVEALQKKSLRLQAALYDALTMRLFPGDIEVQDIVLDHDEGLAEIEAALPEHLRGSK